MRILYLTYHVAIQALVQSMSLVPQVLLLQKKVLLWQVMVAYASWARPEGLLSPSLGSAVAKSLRSAHTATHTQCR